MDKVELNTKIANYYDYTSRFYRKFWYRGKPSSAIHYGFWEDDTKNLEEAFLNTNKFLAQKSNIKSTDYMLDAGCGTGGSSVYIAKNYGCRVLGITLSSVQQKMARQLSTTNNVDGLTDFKIINFLDTGFEPNSFDVVWGIESVCYSSNKADFLREAFRILKPEGRVVIADGFIKSKKLYPKEEKEMFILNDAWAMPNLAHVDGFAEDIKRTGFVDLEVFDKTDEIMPSALRIYLMSIFSYPASVLLEMLNLINPLMSKNNLGGLVQYELFKKRTLAYCVYCFKKPRNIINET